jgi:hypothetical protein
MRALPLIILIFAIWLNIQLRKNRHSSDEDFLQRESKANLSRSRDISALDYIILDISKLPHKDKDDPTLNSYRDTIIRLADKKILNLSGKTNTELKEAYGIANLNFLIEYDNNYITLVSMLYKWAQRLYDASYTQDAQAVLEYALSIKCDAAGAYKLLAKIYKQNNSPEKIRELIEQLSDISIHDKDELIRSLNDLMLS